MGLESLLRMIRQTYDAKQVRVSDFYLPKPTPLPKESHTNPHYLTQHPFLLGDMKTLGRVGIYRFSLRIFQPSLCCKVQQSSELEIIQHVLFKCFIPLCSQGKTSPHPLSIVPGTWELGVQLSQFHVIQLLPAEDKLTFSQQQTFQILEPPYPVP